MDCQCLIIQYLCCGTAKCSLTGPLPPQLFNLNGTLERIHLNDNGLSGRLPTTLGTLTNLRLLELRELTKKVETAKFGLGSCCLTRLTKFSPNPLQNTTPLQESCLSS